jgi:hypothetical protein
LKRAKSAAIAEKSEGCRGRQVRAGCAGRTLIRILSLPIGWGPRPTTALDIDEFPRRLGERHGAYPRLPRMDEDLLLLAGEPGRAADQGRWAIFRARQIRFVIRAAPRGFTCWTSRIPHGPSSSAITLAARTWMPTRRSSSSSTSKLAVAAGSPTIGRRSRLPGGEIASHASAGQDCSTTGRWDQRLSINRQSAWGPSVSQQ